MNQPWTTRDATFTVLSLAFAASICYAQTTKVDVRQVVEPGGLMTAEAPLLAQPAACQPRRNDRVQVLSETRLYATPGADVAAVQVISGVCKGHSGWIGTHRLSESAVSR